MARRSRGSFRVIKNSFDLSPSEYKNFLVGILKKSDSAGNGYIDAINPVVRNWSPRSKPTFYRKSKITGAKVELRVYVKEANPSKPVWKWVNKTGTKPHKIPKSGKTRMTFRWGGKGSYTPKTTSAPLTFGGPGTTSGGIVTKTSVNHPGFKKRGFSSLLNKKYHASYKKQMKRAIVDGLNRIKRG